VFVGALQMLVAHVVGEGKALGEGVDAVVRLDRSEGGDGGGELVVREQAQSKRGKWAVAEEFVIKLQVSSWAAWLRGPLAASHPLRVCVRRWTGAWGLRRP
jgi:hypothetical protein